MLERIDAQRMPCAVEPISQTSSTSSNRGTESFTNIEPDPNHQLQSMKGYNRQTERLLASDMILHRKANLRQELTTVAALETDAIRQGFGVVGSLACMIRDLLLELVARNPQILLLLHALTLRIPSVPCVNLSFNDSIHLIDAFGQRRTLKFATHRHFSVFVSFLAEENKETPSGQYISRNRYRLVDAKATEIQTLNKDSWPGTVKPRHTILLSMFMTRCNSYYSSDFCLPCSSPNGLRSVTKGRKRCSWG